MGNNQENNNEKIGKLNMQIYLNKFNFFPGETIKGFLELSPKEEDSKDSKILNNICPWCAGELLQREGQYGVFYGCKNYPKCKFKTQ